MNHFQIKFSGTAQEIRHILYYELLYDFTEEVMIREVGENSFILSCEKCIWLKNLLNECPKFVLLSSCFEGDFMRNSPTLAVDAVIYMNDGVVLVRRKYPPLGWALPGGKVEIGESCETAVVREVFEETGLEIEVDSLLGVYSAPDRDPRGHVVSIVYLAHVVGGVLKGGDDAVEAQVFGIPVSGEEFDWDLAFDHGEILKDAFGRGK